MVLAIFLLIIAHANKKCKFINWIYNNFVQDFLEISDKDFRQVFSGLQSLSEKHNIPLREQRTDRSDAPRAAAPAAPVRENPAQTMRRLRRKYPAEMKEIMALREENPKEFTRRLQELNRKDRAAAGKK